MTCTKHQLRREVLQRLKAAAAADPAQLRSAKLRKKLSPMLCGDSMCVAIYAPLPHEVNLLPLMQEHPQHRYVFPLCLLEHKLRFHEICSVADDMVPGAMGILAPAPHTVCVEPEEIDFLVVPGVAFTLAGDRMGYGGGYYDRFIPLCTQARVVALAFREQLVDSLPVEEHDLQIPELITPLTRIELSKGCILW